jgi:hypothetical protein
MSHFCFIMTIVMCTRKRRVCVWKKLLVPKSDDLENTLLVFFQSVGEPSKISVEVLLPVDSRLDAFFMKFIING